MQQFANWLLTKIPYPAFLPTEYLYIGVQLIFALLMLMLFVAPFAGIISWVERRVAARMMDRVGPNRVGPQGFLQWLADGIKSLLKEDIIPTNADPILFRLAPYLVFIGMFVAFVVVPFSSKLIIADLNIGIFYLIAVTSIVTVGIMMSGWASNNKYSLLGGMRSAAQIVSYEIPTGLAILVIVLLSGSLSMQEIIAAQGAYPWEWFLFSNPFTAMTFFILFISALAEGNRAPFDIPEAESELVSGYSTEYSGMRFVFFYFEEWANIYLIAAVGTALFLGGWQIPPAVRQWGAATHFILPHLLEFLTFFIKAIAIVFVVIWIRWTLPRVRVDQLMILCWKYLLPFGFACALGTALWMVLFPKGVPLVSYTLFGGAVVTGGYFFYRVWYQLKAANVRVHLNPFV
ncbi:MAG: NADH-quinone oxidoreductase subunit NuoH [Deltaproteobacteria bacterium]|nr:NADH-quinone oxidoreductase subunit NuoH [Deltaproteobacteria bacterium]